MAISLIVDKLIKSCSFFFFLLLGIIMTNANGCVNCSAHDNLMKAHDFLNNKYDYQSAITYYLHASDLYANFPITEVTKQELAQAWAGLAMSYHNIGQATLSNQYIQKVQELLKLPNNATDLIDTQHFSPAAAAYFVVKGYHAYIQYEASQKGREAIEKQESYLEQAKNSFLKSREIAQFSNSSFDRSHAEHGLGTIFEFLGKCAQERHNSQQAYDYAQESVKAFKTALTMRSQQLGAQHLNVARSHHKLARNYAALADLLYSLAGEHYSEADNIFEINKIPLDHAKRKELVDEYALFKKKSKGLS